MGNWDTLAPAHTSSCLILPISKNIPRKMPKQLFWQLLSLTGFWLQTNFVKMLSSSSHWLKPNWKGQLATNQLEGQKVLSKPPVGICTLGQLG